VIRLRAEYLYKIKKDDIKFHFTSGHLLSWNDYKNGTRAFVSGNSVSFRKTAGFDDSYQSFRAYLDLIFNYSGTISLNKETTPVTKNADLKTGDTDYPGSPGMLFLLPVYVSIRRVRNYFYWEKALLPLNPFIYFPTLLIRIFRPGMSLMSTPGNQNGPLYF
jgi:hypothetical protein